MFIFCPKSTATTATLSCHGTTSAKAKRTWPCNRFSTTPNPSTRTPTLSTSWLSTCATPKPATKTSFQSFPKTLTFCTCQKDIYTWPQLFGWPIPNKPVFTKSLFWTIRSFLWPMERSMGTSTTSSGWISTTELWELLLQRPESQVSLQIMSSVWIDFWRLSELWETSPKTKLFSLPDTQIPGSISLLSGGLTLSLW